MGEKKVMDVVYGFHVLLLLIVLSTTTTATYNQGGHSPGKPGKVREFQSGQ